MWNVRHRYYPRDEIIVKANNKGEAYRKGLIYMEEIFNMPVTDLLEILIHSFIKNPIYARMIAGNINLTLRNEFIIGDTAKKFLNGIDISLQDYIVFKPNPYYYHINYFYISERMVDILIEKDVLLEVENIDQKLVEVPLKVNVTKELFFFSPQVFIRKNEKYLSRKMWKVRNNETREKIIVKANNRGEAYRKGLIYMEKSINMPIISLLEFLISFRIGNPIHAMNIVRGIHRTLKNEFVFSDEAEKLLKHMDINLYEYVIFTPRQDYYRIGSFYISEKMVDILVEERVLLDIENIDKEFVEVSLKINLTKELFFH